MALAFPQTYMNLSGESVAQLVRRHGITDPEQIVVVQDELDLPVGKLKVKRGGGLAGHNGLRSIKAHLHTDGFLRVRIGVGKPVTKEQGADHVLKRVSKRDRTELDVVVQEAADAVELILSDGIDAAMNRVNTRDRLTPGCQTGPDDGAGRWPPRGRGRRPRGRRRAAR